MARRKAYTEVKKLDQVRAAHVKDMGDVVFKIFQCFNPECQEIIAVREDTLGEDFEIECPVCGYVHRMGDAQKFYDYELWNTTTNKKIEDGSFEILIDDYVAEAMQYKCCIICNALKPLEAFHKHAPRKSGRQGLSVVSARPSTMALRIRTDNRSASRSCAKETLYLDITGPGKIDSGLVRKRFDNKCFKCGCDLSGPEGRSFGSHASGFTLWPLTTDNATLLCGLTMGEIGSWPSETTILTQN